MQTQNNKNQETRTRREQEQFQMGYQKGRDDDYVPPIPLPKHFIEGYKQGKEARNHCYS